MPNEAILMKNAADRAWVRGFVTAMAELRRRNLGGQANKDICAIMRAAGLTTQMAREAHAFEGDVKELLEAGCV